MNKLTIANILTIIVFITYFHQKAYAIEDKTVIWYKHQLRELFEKEKNVKIQNIIYNEYNNIYNNIISKAKEGINKLDFRLFCTPIQYVDNQKYMNILTTTYNLIVEENQEQIQKYNISENDLISEVLVQLQTTFIDSNITYWRKNQDKYYKYRCDLYTIYW
jgi:hypothetical protein